jgi:endogenous inhibitor of DNA gyrase (YacG/DUF329 family)
MYKTCPKCGHTSQQDNKHPASCCPKCGLIYRKWFKNRFHINRSEAELESSTGSFLSRGNLTELLLYLKPETNKLEFYVRCIIFICLLAWGWQFIQMDYYYYVNGARIDSAAPDIYASFLHNVNLLFHEAGHVLFRPFGEFMTILGGSLLQIIVPLLVTLVFLLKERNTFGAASGLWWTGQNFMDVAPYINDARARQIPLLGGGDGSDRPAMHDWYNILTDLGILNSDHFLAGVVDGIGVLLMSLSFVWGAWVLRRQYQCMKKPAMP